MLVVEAKMETHHLLQVVAVELEKQVTLTELDMVEME
jgi:hypothetical protein